jgi:hypothetical protein
LGVLSCQRPAPALQRHDFWRQDFQITLRARFEKNMGAIHATFWTIHLGNCAWRSCTMGMTVPSGQLDNLAQAS